jgi:drug/metabolite transporter (DMT)-like permease
LLVLATGFWGASFVLMKALGQHQQTLLPGAGSWFLASVSLLARFGLGALVVGLWQCRHLRTLKMAEAWQGLGLGFFGGIGMLFQMDGVMHTSASTSAFLTQCYCIFIPIWVVFRGRVRLGGLLLMSCSMVLAGVAILADIDWAKLRPGRGEVETVVSSLFFTGQILWLQRAPFAANRTMVVTLIMFVVVAVLVLPVALITGGGPSPCLAVFGSVPALAMIGFLTLGCTVIAYGLMNAWQPHLPATQAALIYCCEPLFASVFALFLPARLSRLAHINYANELISWRLLVGGGLITAANLLVLWQGARAAKLDRAIAAVGDQGAPSNHSFTS